MTTDRNDRSKLPVDSFKEAATFMRRPFTPAAVKFKVQATWPKDEPTGGLIVTYIDARLVVERLNLIIPHRWHDEYKAIGNGQMWCFLTVDGITRCDVGDGTGKGLVSDALKRAGVKFGIGVSLYAMPKIILRVSDGHLERKQTRDGVALALTANGEARAREMYVTWLRTNGTQAFGEPFDHGDVEPVTGDVESEPQAQPSGADMPASLDGDGPVAQQVLDELMSIKQRAGLPDSADSREWVRQQLAAVGVDDVPQRVTVATLRRLTNRQASSLIDVFQDVIDKREEATS